MTARGRKTRTAAHPAFAKVDAVFEESSRGTRMGAFADDLNALLEAFRGWPGHAKARSQA